MHRLTIRVDSTRPNHPQVRLLVDGEDLLATDGADQGNDPEAILTTGALLPTDPPQRIAFYGCGCGEFGCGNVAGLVVRRGDRIEWADFCSVTGVYGEALPPPEDAPDPLATGDPDLLRHPLDLPTLSFDAEEYLAVVREATADRSWETPARQVARHLRELRPDLVVWPSRRSTGITLEGTVTAYEPAVELAVPAGPPEALAANLLSLLDQGLPARRIAGEGLWRGR